MTSVPNLLLPLNGNNMAKIKVILLMALLCSPFILSAQSTDYGKQYEAAKKMVDESRYEAAAQILKPILKEEPGNEYALYSQYLFAYTLSQQGKHSESRDMLLQLKQKHTDWKEYPKVNWLLATAYANMKEYRKSVALAQQIDASNVGLDEWKTEYYSLIQPLDTVVAIQKAYPLDLKLAEVLYLQVYQRIDAKYKVVAQRLEKEYGFKPPVKERKPFKNEVKSRYHIALLFPFQWKDIDLTSSQRSNQYVLDMYAGMQIAVDSLNRDRKGAPIELHAYDTEKDVNKVTQIVKYNEWKLVDVVIGPMFPEQYSAIKDLPELENKTLISPMSANPKYAENTGSFLYRASIESMVACMANYAAANFVVRKNTVKDPGIVPKKNVLILYGKEIKDSILAYHYKDSIVKRGFTVKKILKVDYNYMGALRTFANDSLGLITYSHIVALSSDPIFAANFISLIEITQQQVPIFTYSDWLDNTQLSYKQMDKRGVYFIDPDYVRTSSATYKHFHKAYIAKYHVFPNVYVLQGFEMATLLGKALREKGTDLSLYFNEKKFFSLGMLGGYDYSNASCNQFVPITTFKDLKLTLVNEEIK
ncbi:MAG: amino acid/amide transporter substrate-binding protein family [Cytophagaceae bacterium]|nr:amino acid/amide transporter substrate-binding protein family [Cytophagaceae bacterium]